MELQYSPLHDRCHAEQSAPRDLDGLSILESRSLDALFRTASSSHVQALDGHPRGRMLAVPGLEGGWIAPVVRWYARSRLMVWEGKSFCAERSRKSGSGFNRVRLFGRRRLFSFRTYEVPSLVDGKPCIAIAYDVPENPSFVRPTYDEVRMISDGLFLGRGMRRRAGGVKLLVWFALDTRLTDGEP